MLWTWKEITWHSCFQNCALASAISIARHLGKYESKTDKAIRKLKKRISQLEEEIEQLKKGE